MYTPPMAPYLGTIPLPIVHTPAVTRDGYPTPPDTPPHEFQSSLFPSYNTLPHNIPPPLQAGSHHHNGYARSGPDSPLDYSNVLGLYFPDDIPPPYTAQQQQYEQQVYSRPVASMPQTSPEHPYSISPADAYWRDHFGANSRPTYVPAPTTSRVSEYGPAYSSSSSSSTTPPLQGVRYEEAPVVPLFSSSSSDSFYGDPRDDAYGPAANLRRSSRRYRQEEGDSSSDEGDSGRRKRGRWAENNRGSNRARP